MSNTDNPTTDIQTLRDCATRVAEAVGRIVDAVTISHCHYTARGDYDETPAGWFWTISVSMPRARSRKNYSMDYTGHGDSATLAGLNQAADEVIESIQMARERGDVA